MITKAVVVEIIDNYNLRVRIPIYDRVEYAISATPNNELSIASICCQPNYEPQFQIGDIVIIGFEDNNKGNPIILGKFFYNEENLNKIYTNQTFQKINILEYAELPTNTKIGNITKNELQYLVGVESNIQNQIDILKQQIDELKTLIK